MGIREEVGANVLALRQAQGLSQAALADRSGLNYTFIGNVERAQKAASIETLERLAKALDVDVAALVNRKEKRIALQNPPPRPDPLRNIVALLERQPPETIDMVERVLRELLRPLRKKVTPDDERAFVLKSEARDGTPATVKPIKGKRVSRSGIRRARHQPGEGG